MKQLYLVWYEKGKVLNKIGLLSYSKNRYKFEYVNYENNDLQLFSNNGLYYGFMDINKLYESDTLFSNIKNRLPSKKRDDYMSLIHNLGLDINSDDFEILEKTKGKISNDNFLFITLEEYNKLKESIDLK